MSIKGIRRHMGAKAAGVVLFAGAAGMLAAGNADAATWTAYTTDSGATGAHAVYTPDKLSACDTQSDGLRAYASVTWRDSAGNYQGASIDDANGSGTCTTKYIPSLTPGTHFTLSACLKNGSGGALQYCGTKTGTI